MNNHGSIKRRWLHAALFFIVTLCGMQMACSSVQPVKKLPVQMDTPLTMVNRPTLKVMTLNLAHGRKDGLNQLFKSEGTIRNNLGEIAAFLDKSGVDIVALQEADAPSRWSGNFDHVALLAEQAGYPVYESSNQANSWLFSYGTALLSRVSLSGVLHHTFRPSPPTMNKGYTLGQVVWQPMAGEPVLVDVVSVHLDFSRKSVREQQSAELSETLAGRGNPMIVMGDFNSDWSADEEVVRALAERTGLHVYQPEAGNLATYHSSTRRFDWILISKQLEFVSFEVLPDVLSDHSAVVAEIAMRPSGETGGALQGVPACSINCL
jgi:endonuclease/exonuclease/phosphatase family metal-dependent hydrolase